VLTCFSLFPLSPTFLVDGFYGQELAEIAEKLLDFVYRLAAEVRNLELQHGFRRRGWDRWWSDDRLVRSEAASVVCGLHVTLKKFDGNLFPVLHFPAGYKMPPVSHARVQRLNLRLSTRECIAARAVVCERAAPGISGTHHVGGALWARHRHGPRAARAPLALPSAHCMLAFVQMPRDEYVAAPDSPCWWRNRVVVSAASTLVRRSLGAAGLACAPALLGVCLGRRLLLVAQLRRKL
jgi:hypothetical protein